MTKEVPMDVVPRGVWSHYDLYIPFPKRAGFWRKGLFQSLQQEMYKTNLEFLKPTIEEAINY